MSKIYEALRQAELDRANNGSIQPDPGKKAQATGQKPQATSQAVLDADAAPDSMFSPDAGTFETVEPASRAVTERTLASALVDTRTAADLQPTEIREPALSPGNAGPTDFDLADIPQHAWHPMMEQLPALEERGSSVEQFRSLRSRMQEFRDLNKLKSILVSSGLPQEGKSFVATNLAISFARHKAGRVLLIDGDMRRATLHKRLGCAQAPGLTEYLAGDATMLEIMQRPRVDDPENPLPSGLASLTFIGSGVEHDKAADLSGNHRFEKLIAAVSPCFDWIVVDSSPVNLVSDGVNLARACDAVLLVARGGVTKYEVAQRAVAELKACKILGIVLNAVKNPQVAGGYYGYDGYDKVEA